MKKIKSKTFADFNEDESVNDVSISRDYGQH